ncbi:hypothetical protein CYMTET_52211 [Cymbomonas tetramitiformis]|uniref:Uncharacterized protein n=1 Tax=Cymbomonas tetramitiformis TaxID=36881 RepID=A0AAE0BKM9_9CHLO|nr:hypothetical protein CYMTET_52211 [Cymbomonas tetramitiformis]
MPAPPVIGAIEASLRICITHFARRVGAQVTVETTNTHTRKASVRVENLSSIEKITCRKFSVIQTRKSSSAKLYMHLTSPLCWFFLSVTHILVHAMWDPMRNKFPGGTQKERKQQACAVSNGILQILGWAAILHAMRMALQEETDAFSDTLANITRKFPEKYEAASFKDRFEFRTSGTNQSYLWYDDGQRNQQYLDPAVLDMQYGCSGVRPAALLHLPLFARALPVMQVQATGSTSSPTRWCVSRMEVYYGALFRVY